MGSPNPLIEIPADRTPYGACGWVFAIVCLLFILSAYGLWHVAGWTKKHGIAIYSAPNSTTNEITNAAQQALDTAKQAASNQVKIQADQAQKAIQDAAAQELQRRADQAQQDAKAKLQQYLQ